MVCVGFLFCVAVASFTVLGTESDPPYDLSVSIQGMLIDVDRTSSHQKLTLVDIEIEGHQHHDRILVFAPLYPPLEYGDVLSLRCILDRPEPFEGFAYDRYLASKDIYATCFVYDVPLVVGDASQSIRGFLLRAREGAISQIDRLFGEPHASLLVGLLFGEQRFTDEWEEHFLRTGTTHIVAASGYNVSLVTLIVFGALASLGMRRQRALGLLVASIACYVILAGADAAVVRAGVMGTLILFSRHVGRCTTMTNVLLLTATLMLVENPRLLRDDVGFQLSMLSTIGLVYIAPILQRRWKMVPEAFGIREALTATVSATFMSLPILLLQFRSASLSSIVANLLVLPFVPYAMLFGAAASVASVLLLGAGQALGLPAWATLSAILEIIRALSDLPLFVESISVLAALGLCAVWVFVQCLLWKHLLGNKFALRFS